MRNWGLLFALVAWPAALLAPAPASAQTSYALQATDDTYLREDQATTNFATATTLRTQGPAVTDEDQTLVLFSLSGIPAGPVVISATLSIRVSTAAASSTVRVHRATTSWTETGATWTNMSANYAATVEDSLVPSTAGAFLNFDVTNLVRQWRSGTYSNYGFMLTATGTGEARFSSSEDGTTSRRPVLTVVTTILPSYSVAKSSVVVSDPMNGTTNPKRMPGAVIEYSATVSSTNAGVADADTIAIAEAVPAQSSLYVGAAPVTFTNGTPSSGLTFTYTSLGSGTDDLSFSSDGGSSYTYTPVPDGGGYDSAVTHMRIAPKGVFAGDGGGADPNFTYTFRVRAH